MMVVIAKMLNKLMSSIQYYSLRKCYALSFKLIALCTVVSFYMVINTTKAYKDLNLKTVKQKETEKQSQRICLLAGPHKTGSTTIQNNFKKWYNVSLSHPEHHNWVWPNQREKEYYYNIILSLMPKSDDNQKIMEAIYKTIRMEFGTLQKSYQKSRDEMTKHWKDGYNIVFGSEVLDLVSTKGNKTFFERFSSKLLPEDALDEQINVVVMYRTSKIKHLISMWHESLKHSEVKKTFASFVYDRQYFPALYGLKLVRKLLQHTKWNIDLVPLEPLVEDGWEVSSFVACEILKVKCNKKKPVKADAPTMMNVYDKNDADFNNDGKEEFIVPNVPNQTLAELDRILNIFDCNYCQLATSKNNRLTIHYSKWFEKRMTKCKGRIQNFSKSSTQMTYQVKKAVASFVI